MKPSLLPTKAKRNLPKASSDMMNSDNTGLLPMVTSQRPFPIPALKKARKQPSSNKSPTNESKPKTNNSDAAAIGRGVTMRPSGKWQAQLYFAGQSRYIGVFDNREHATTAYEVVREKLKGGDAVPWYPGPEAEKAWDEAKKAAHDMIAHSEKIQASSGVHVAAARTEASETESEPEAAVPVIVQHHGRRSSLTKAIQAAEILNEIAHHIENGAVVGPPAPEMKQKSLPDWIEKKIDTYGERLDLDHLDWNPPYRRNNGWKGSDYIHGPDSAVKIIDYFVSYGDGYETLARGGEGTTLTGIVYFSSKAESHKGVCHGGAMATVLDDVIGWAGFCATGECRPWSGYTVQVNSSFRKPIPVDTYLLACGTISQITGRKVSVLATILDPANDDFVHAEGDGLVIMNRGVMPGT